MTLCSFPQPILCIERQNYCSGVSHSPTWKNLENQATMSVEYGGMLIRGGHFIKVELKSNINFDHFKGLAHELCLPLSLSRTPELSLARAQDSPLLCSRGTAWKWWKPSSMEVMKALNVEEGTFHIMTSFLPKSSLYGSSYLLLLESEMPQKLLQGDFWGTSELAWDWMPVIWEKGTGENPVSPYVNFRWNTRRSQLVFGKTLRPAGRW